MSDSNENKSAAPTSEPPELWTTDDIASYLKMTAVHVRRIALNNPHFPRPIRLTRGSRQFWVKSEVVGWILKQRH